MRSDHPEVAIIDYQMSNLYSVKAACDKIGISAVITSDPGHIANAKGAILPGVGAFGEAMAQLSKMGLDRCIKEFVDTGKPFLGICLGMQLLLTESLEFGRFAGLGLIDGQVKKFDFYQDDTTKYPVPQIGWNRIRKVESWDHTLLRGNRDGDFMYFVHSYYAAPTDKSHILATTRYGNTEFCSALGRNNIFAVQFHPEKSAQTGLKIYEQFKNHMEQQVTL